MWGICWMRLLGLVCGAGSIGNVSRDDFPPWFAFFAASSAYQMEGAANEDGRTASIWDTFAHAGYMIGATGDIACDVYHKYKEDVQLMVKTGLEAFRFFRFSISWSGLIPNGRGPIKSEGFTILQQLYQRTSQPW